MNIQNLSLHLINYTRAKALFFYFNKNKKVCVCVRGLSVNVFGRSWQ